MKFRLFYLLLKIICFNYLLYCNFKVNILLYLFKYNEIYNWLHI